MMQKLHCIYDTNCNQQHITKMHGKPQLFCDSHSSYRQESSTTQPAGQTDIVLAASQTHLATANI